LFFVFFFPGKSDPAVAQKQLSQHLTKVGKCNFLYLRMTLDLIEQGAIVPKSSGFKIVPVSLNEVSKRGKLCQLRALEFPILLAANKEMHASAIAEVVICHFLIIPQSNHALFARQVFLQTCNLRFMSYTSFDDVRDVIAVALASLYPLKDEQLYQVRLFLDPKSEFLPE